MGSIASRKKRLCFFFVGIEYEKLLYFCSNCKIIGCSLDNCRNYPKGGQKSVNEVGHVKGKVDKERSREGPRKNIVIYVPKGNQNLVRNEDKIIEKENHHESSSLDLLKQRNKKFVMQEVNMEVNLQDDEGKSVDNSVNTEYEESIHPESHIQPDVALQNVFGTNEKGSDYVSNTFTNESNSKSASVTISGRALETPCNVFDKGKGIVCDSPAFVNET